MIRTLKDFVLAVEQMRQCQREYFLTKGYGALAAAKKCEAVVDACIKKKHAEWEAQGQPEFFSNEVTHG
jgi:hypothetical protein